MKARFILSNSKLIEQYNTIKNLADFVSYSLKTNPVVGKVLESSTACFFSIHTLEDIENIKDNKRIWFFAQAITKENLDFLLKKEVNSFVIDNENDLKVLLDYIKDKKFHINLLLRMKLKENTIHTGKHFVFGFSAADINNLVPELKKNESIEKLGIHFHRKTQNISEWALKEELSDSLSEETLKQIDLLNIGGGIPVKYKNYSDECLDNIFKKIKELKEWLNKKSIKMIIEPGRFLAAPCIRLETEIISVYNSSIIVNCSVYNAAMDTFVAHIRLLVEGELENGTPYTIKGKTPDSMDIFRYKVFLKTPKVGDKIVLINAGAYNYSTDFCNLEKLGTVIES